MTSRNKRQNLNSGSTLLLGVLVLSVISASVYVLGTVAMRAVTQVSGVVVGEAAVSGADASVEKGLWSIIRSQTATQGNCDVEPKQYQSTTLTIDGRSFTNKYCRSRLLTNPYTFYLTSNETKKVYIVDYEDVNEGAGYNSLVFDWVSGSGSVKICSWLNSNCEASPDIASFSQNTTNGQTIPLVSSQKYVIILKANIQGYWVSVTGDPKAIPDELITINGTGESSTIQRNIETKILPN